MAKRINDNDIHIVTLANKNNRNATDGMEEVHIH